MSWQQYLNCRVEVEHQGQTYTWEKELPLPHQIPLSHLFVHRLPVAASSVAKKGLSLQLRKALWSFENIEHQVWLRAARELSQWLSALPFKKERNWQLNAYQAGVAVAMVMQEDARFKQPKLTIHAHEAPLSWLKRRLASRKARVKAVAGEQGPWELLRSVSPKRRAA